MVSVSIRGCNLTTIRLFLTNNLKFTISFTVFTIIIVFSIMSRFFINFNPMQVGLFVPLTPPSLSHIMGVDGLGRDVFAQVALGTALSLQIGFTAALISIAFGTIIGVVAGYYGGKVDAILRGIIDIMITVPMLPVLILVSASLRSIDVFTMALILALFSWPWPARQIRGEFISLKEREFIKIAKLSGMSNMEIIIQELIPHMLPWVAAALINTVLWAILAETSLEILGLGPQHIMTLGMIIYWAIFYGAVMRGVWWWWGFPIITLVILFISLYTMSEEVISIISPRRK